MKKFATYLLATCAFSLGGCATPRANYEPVAREISYPPLNQIVTAMVGDEMVKQGTFVDRDALILDEPVKVGLLGPYTINPGTFLKTGEDRSTNFYALTNAFPGGGSISKAALSDPPQAVQVYKTKPRLCVVTVFNVHACGESQKFRFGMHPAIMDNSFQQTLIYSGKVGQKINIGYREFSSNMARPAYNNDVEYDLSEAMIFGYKGAKIEVLEATNESIKYRVIRNFNTEK